MTRGQREDDVMTEQTLEGCGHKPRNAGAFQNLEEEWILPESLPEEPALLTPCFEHQESTHSGSLTSSTVRESISGA